MIEWPIYRNFSVFSQNSGYFDQNEKGVKKCPFPQSLRFCHNWWASGGVPGVRYAEKLSALFYLHWESLWPGVCYDFRGFGVHQCIIEMFWTDYDMRWTERTTLISMKSLFLDQVSIFLSKAIKLFHL